MNGKIYLELLAEDKSTITYRPRLASFTNSALAAILLQQIIYWWKKQDGKPFFKFRAPSSHKKYQPGDSWCEELELNPHEFDGALKIIGTKITKGISKADALATEMPTRKDDETDQEFYDRLKVAVSRCVIYWTDSSRITWYLLNEQLLGNFVSRIYLDKCYSLKYLKSAVLADTYKNRKPANTSNSETTTETNTETTTGREETPALIITPEALAMNGGLRIVTHAPSAKPDITPIQSELPKAAGAEPNPPHSARSPLSTVDPMGDSMRQDYAAYVYAWQSAQDGFPPPLPQGKAWTDAIDLAKHLKRIGVTPDDISAYVKERQKAGKSLAIRFVFSDIHEYMNAKSPKSGAQVDAPPVAQPVKLPKPIVTYPKASGGENGNS